MFPRELAAPGLGFLGTIAIAMLYGRLHGGTNLFFDWRALAFGVGIYVVFAMWVQTPAEARWAMFLFAGYMAARICCIYVSFLRGGGDVIVGVRIPVFDGPTCRPLCFTAILASVDERPRSRLVGESACGWVSARLLICSSCCAFGERSGSSWELRRDCFCCCRNNSADANCCWQWSAVAAVAMTSGTQHFTNACRALTSQPGSQSSARAILTMSAKFWTRGRK